MFTKFTLFTKNGNTPCRGNASNFNISDPYFSADILM